MGIAAFLEASDVFLGFLDRRMGVDADGDDSDNSVLVIIGEDGHCSTGALVLGEVPPVARGFAAH